MRRLMVFGLCVLMSTLFFTLLPMPSAMAAGWEWRQTDWAGGPGQATWLDSSRYDYSDLVDTMSVPGTLRLSHLSNQYTKEPSNPVVAPGAPGEWDSENAYGYPRRREGGGYEMLYKSSDAAWIVAAGYASSDDGVTWTKYDGNPVLERSSDSGWDGRGVMPGPVLDEGDHYTMLFAGNDASGPDRYGLATSPDLKTWMRTTDPVFGPGGPASWEASVDGLILVQEGGGYRLWYQGFDGVAACRIGTATSDDGITWVKDAGNPILGPDAGAWDAGSIRTYSILKRPWVGDFMMAYSASDGANNYGIGLAFSSDGVTWTKYAGNPVMVTGGPGSWNEKEMDMISLDFDGGMYKMIVSAADAAFWRNVGEIYSTDGLMWFENPFGNPTMSCGVGSAWDNAAIFSMDIFMEGGNTLRAFYNAYGGAAPYRGVGTATAAPGYPGFGALISSVFDAGSQAQWGEVTWDEMVPAGTGANVAVRTGDVPVPDGTWSPWMGVTNGATVPGGPTRYVQYMVQMSSPGNATPVVSNLAIDITDALPSTWYFAEGYTGPGFDEWVTIENPGMADAHVWVTYYTPSAPPELRPHTVPAHSRYNIYVNSDLGENLDNSFKIESDQPIICERPMYFRYVPGVRDWVGGSDAMGSTQLSRQWYFAEGCTAASFDEYLTIQNPNPDWATVDVTYMANGAQPIRKQHRVKPNSRYTILVDADAGAELEVSAAISSDQPILAERPMYFDLGGMQGGHIVMGSPFLNWKWYLAEGATYYPFSEFITIQNPNDAPADVTIEYNTPTTAPITTTHTIAANSRYTVNARTDAGVDSEVSACVYSKSSILVERPMYFEMLGGELAGGHCAVGVNAPSKIWDFAEGYTGPGFDTFITVQNPGGVAANINVTYYVLGGTPINRTHTVEPHSRYTIGAGADAGEGLSIAVHVNSDQPVICERPMYFFYQGLHAYNWAGGHDSQGFAP